MYIYTHTCGHLASLSFQNLAFIYISSSTFINPRICVDSGAARAGASVPSYELITCVRTYVRTYIYVYVRSSRDNHQIHPPIVLSPQIESFARGLCVPKMSSPNNSGQVVNSTVQALSNALAVALYQAISGTGSSSAVATSSASASLTGPHHANAAQQTQSSAPSSDGPSSSQQ